MTMTTDDAGVPDYYKASDATVRPGDIVRLSPQLQALKPPVVHVSSARQTTKDQRVLAELHGVANGTIVPAAIAEGKKNTEIVFKGKLDLAVLLTRGCDVDHGKVRQLAAIRPLSEIQKEEDQIAVIQGKHIGLHYLPRAAQSGQEGELFDESFVDLRYIVTVHRELFDGLERPLSLTPSAILDLYFSWTRHTLGKEIPAELRCPHCGKAVPIFEEVSTMIEPPPDY